MLSTQLGVTWFLIKELYFHDRFVNIGFVEIMTTRKVPNVGQTFAKKHFYNMAKVLSFLRHGVGDSQMNVQIIGKERHLESI